MAKSLNDILKRYSDALSGKRESSVSALTTGDNPGVDYADKMKDTRDFIAQHSVEKHEDRVGNGDDVYNASNVKKAEMERHGHEPKPKDIKVYKKNQQVGQPENKLKEEAEELDEAGSQYRSAAGSGKNTNPNLSKLARKLSFEKPRSYRPPGEKSKAENREMLNDLVGKFMKKGGKITKEEAELDEAKDSKEYGYEGDMAVTQLKTICRHAEHLMKMMKPDTDLPEWVQSKITKAEDYISTAHDYLMSEMNEEVEQIDELTGYRKKKLFGKDPLVAVANRAINRMKLPPNDGGKLSPKELASNKKNHKVSQMAFDRMEEEVEELEEAKAPEIGSYHKVDTEGSHGKHVVTNVADGVVYHQNVKTKEKHRTRVSEWASASSPIKEEVGLTEAKCNMTEAGKMCEVHGMKACPKEEGSASDKEPRYNGKKKEGKQLITDKNIQEKLTKSTSAGEVISDFVHSDDPKFKGKSKEERKRMALGAYYSMHPEKSKKKVEESISDQRSAKSTASEKAREKMMNALERRKLEKMKEQAAPAETIIKMPSGVVGDTGRV